MIHKIKEFLDDTNIDILVGLPYVLAFTIGYIFHSIGFDDTDDGSFITIGLILFIGGMSFLFSFYKKEYPVYFRLKIKGRSAQVFSAVGLIFFWAIAIAFFVATRYV